MCQLFRRNMLLTIPHPAGLQWQALRKPVKWMGLAYSSLSFVLPTGLGKELPKRRTWSNKWWSGTKEETATPHWTRGNASRFLDIPQCLMVENGMVFAYGLYTCSHEFWIILRLFKLPRTIQLYNILYNICQTPVVGNINKIIYIYPIWTQIFVFFFLQISWICHWQNSWFLYSPVMVLSGRCHLQTEALWSPIYTEGPMDCLTLAE